MKINLSYNVASLHEAARYIWDNNPSVEKWSSAPKSAIDVMKQIKDDMFRYAKYNAQIILKEKRLGVNLSNEWKTFTGTGGYYLLFALEEDTEELILISIDILVDPAVGHPVPRYISEELTEIDTTTEPV